MKKNLLTALGMCVILGMSACGKNVDSDQTTESIPAVESTENAKETINTTETENVEVMEIETLKDYLEFYGRDNVEGQYITIGKVEGLTFVPRENTNGCSIAIYNNGEQCGWISAYKFDSADWMDEAETKLTVYYSSHTGGAEIKEETETEYGKRYLVVDESNQPYTYGDTEWLINSGVFKDMKEAQAGHDSRYFVVYGAQDSEYVYVISIDKHFMNDTLFEGLLNQVSFKEGAFTKEAQESFVKEIQEVFSEFSPKESIYREDDLFTRLFKSSNSDSMQVRFKVNDLTYRIPDNMMAIQTGKGVWNLFKYSMSDGGKEIGTVEYLTVDVKAENLQDLLQEFTEDAVFTDAEEIKGGQLFTFTQNGEENVEHVFVVPKKGETVLHLQYKVF